jgi:hypothetical protein
MPRPEINKWLDRVFRGATKDAPALLATTKKGGFTVQEMLVSK